MDRDELERADWTLIARLDGLVCKNKKGDHILVLKEDYYRMREIAVEALVLRRRVLDLLHPQPPLHQDENKQKRITEKKQIDARRTPDDV